MALVNLGGGLIATGVVLGTFGLLFVDSLDQYPLSRSVTAVAGTVLLIGLGVVSPHRVIQAVSVETLLLLFGMLVHVTILARSGFYDWVATQLVTRADTPRRSRNQTRACPPTRWPAPRLRRGGERTGVFSRTNSPVVSASTVERREIRDPVANFVSVPSQFGGQFADGHRVVGCLEHNDHDETVSPSRITSRGACVSVRNAR